MALRPLNGFVRTSAWRTGGSSCSCSGSKSPFAIVLREYRMLWTTTRPSSRRCSPAGSVAWAWRMLTYSVSPPVGGTSRPDSSDAIAGTGLNELSVCQSWLPDW